MVTVTYGRLKYQRSRYTLCKRLLTQKAPRKEVRENRTVRGRKDLCKRTVNDRSGSG